MGYTRRVQKPNVKERDALCYNYNFCMYSDSAGRLDLPRTSLSQKRGKALRGPGGARAARVQLGLAQFLVDPPHPFHERVAVETPAPGGVAFPPGVQA